MKEYVTELTFISEKLRKYDAIIAKKFIFLFLSLLLGKLK